MKKALLMPLLSMPSGHHQVADALAAYFQREDPTVVCEKADLLSYTLGKLEAIVCVVYTAWIHRFPGTYSRLYRYAAYRKKQAAPRFRSYELLFLKPMQRILSEHKPDIVLCTHCLPSYLASRLKRKGLLTVPVVNVYTDFFVNDVWGIEGVDLHFVPDQHIKHMLLEKGVRERQIVVTGIPVHPHISDKAESRGTSDPLTVLVCGGSLGAGFMKTLIQKAGPSGNVRYIVLCGKNRRLYKELAALRSDFIIPLPYIGSREEMNKLYDHIDLVLTKPGGVTVSECLIKGIPMIVYHALPGQEEINLQHLLRLGLTVHWQDWTTGSVEQRLKSLSGSSELEQWRTRMTRYRQQIARHELSDAIRQMIR